MLQRIPARSITAQVQEQLKELVLSGAYDPGAKLPSERDLAEALGVSRTALREAVRGLEALGLVTIKHGSGVYVADELPASSVSDNRIPSLEIKYRSAADLIEVRLIVEPEMSALAALRATEEDLSRLARDVDEFREDLGTVQRPLADIQFHLDLCRAAHNRPLLVIVQWVIQFYASSGQMPQLQDVLDHERIYQAIRRHDADAARNAMRSHLQWVEQRL